MTLDGVVTAWNPAAEQMHGYSAAEMIGERIHRLVPPESWDDEGAVLDRIREGQRVDHQADQCRWSLEDVAKTWILVIEDIRDQAELWADVCAQAGLNAMTAATGLQGYRRALDVHPALILLDLKLPDIDGWEVCRRLKTDPRTTSIPVVILTAHDERDGPGRAAAAGCAAFLKKPCPPAELVAVIKRTLLRQDLV
jgi:two-component system, cell cycle response regulator DivK